ncbi:Equilibrative nucleoside transporter 3 [Seminavis robusta]|uniref:Equilibrative nucleoside transporter 3 n=1 Tax=Seminavis robusta TaxID=568900 RepID=A0A9N8D817_9STRA|nr:Equilibrative nucleoside transporter 3 [Seminavis robusta]|eukprot:Sro11_g008950.1 Equilibrative nucleoside transporter 3 (589) ;mRNA; r:203899-205665
MSPCCCFLPIRAVSDRCARYIFLLLGIGILVPWNAFISAVPYFQSRICSIPGAEAQFESWVGLIFNLSSVGALTLLLSWPLWKHQFQKLFLFRRRIPHNEIETVGVGVLRDNHHQVPPEPSPHHQPSSHDAPPDDAHYNASFWMVTIPLTLSLCVFVVTDLLVAIQNITPSAFLVVTLMGMSLCGACAAFAQAGTVATSGFFPGQVGINPFVSGQAVGGVLVSAANFISAMAEDPQVYWDQHCDHNHENNSTTATAASKATTTKNHNNTTLGHYSTTTCPPYQTMDAAVFIYFLVGACVLLACVMGYTLLDASARARRLQEQYETVGNTTDESTIEEFRDEPVEITSSQSHQHQQPFDIAQEGCDSVCADNNEEDVYETSSSDRMAAGQHDDVLRTATAELQPPQTVLQAIKGPAFCIFFTFFVTLSLFPSWTSRLQSIHQCQPNSNRLSNDLYVPFTFLLFNIGDLTGRELAGRILALDRMDNVSFKLVMASIARFLFFPMLLLCVGGSSSSSHHGIPSDFYSVTVQALFALSNGALITLAFMHAPSLLPATVPGANEKSSEILTLSLSLGLFCGSLFAFPVSKLAS